MSKSLWQRITKSAKNYLLGQEPTHTSTEEDPNLTSGNERFSNEAVPNTPFRVVGNKEKGYFLALGNHRLTEFYDTPGEAISQLIKTKWEIMLNLMTTVAHTYNDIKPQQNNTENK